MKSFLLQTAVAILAALPALAHAQSITGNWRTPTGSVVQVYSCGNAACLRILAVEASAPGTLDEENPNPALRSRSLCNLQIGKDFQPKDQDKSADNGQIYDPKSGKTYSGSLTLNGSDRLKLRGYVGVKLFGRTEEWTRFTGTVPPCK